MSDDRYERLQRRLRILAVAAILAGLPFTVSAKQGLKANFCSADDGSCCPKNAICGLNGQNYPGFHLVAGSCPET